MTRTDLLNQADIWVDGAGKVYRLDEMDRHHRANLIPFLRGNAKSLQLQATLSYYGSTLGMEDNESDGVAALKNRIEADLHSPPEDWLERTPLMRRLVELEAGRSIAARTATAARNKAYELATGYQKVRPS